MAAAGDDTRLEQIVFGRFLSPEARKDLYTAYKEIEALWEILSPARELRDHIDTFQRLVRLYTVVRNAYADSAGFVAELAHKTKRLVEGSTTIQGLGNVTKAVTFDLRTLAALSRESGPDEAKVFNLVRGLQAEAEREPGLEAVLRPLKEPRRTRAEGPRRAHHIRTRGDGIVGGRRQRQRVRRSSRQRQYAPTEGVWRLLDAEG